MVTYAAFDGQRVSGLLLHADCFATATMTTTFPGSQIIVFLSLVTLGCADGFQSSNASHKLPSGNTERESSTHLTERKCPAPFWRPGLCRRWNSATCCLGIQQWLRIRRSLGCVLLQMAMAGLGVGPLKFRVCPLSICRLSFSNVLQIRRWWLLCPICSDFPIF